MEWLRSKWKFDKCFTVEGMARGEGLALLWIKELKAEVRSYSRYHIDVRIEEVKKGRAWSFIGFYENPKTSKRQCSWEILQRLKTNNALPWMCVGDFNEIISNEEKLGGVVRPKSQMAGFRETLEDCGLSEMKTIGAGFIWSKGKGSNVILEKT